MDQMPPQAQVMQIVTGLMKASAVCALARLGVPNHLESGPKTTEELAQLVQAKSDLLYRLMRATEGMGILARTADGKWEQTPMSATLRTNSPTAMGDLAVFISDEWHCRGFGTLDETIRSGKVATERIYGMSTFEFLRENPEAGEHFNRAMTAYSTLDAPAIVDAYDFSGIKSLTDVGGGHGLLLTTILNRYPAMQATLYDLPQVIETLNGGLNPAVAERICVEKGNMFESVPPGADAYIMKNILHDWSDDHCGKILSGCRAGVRDGGKLIVAETVVPGSSEFSPAKISDLTMMLFTGGRERTEEEFRALLAASGWKLNRIVPTRSQLSVIEAVPNA